MLDIFPMAKKKLKSRVHSPSEKKHHVVKKRNHSRLFILFLIFVALSIPVIIYMFQQPVGLSPQAAKETYNLNEVTGINFTNNPDGTMGPVSYTENYASSMTSPELGSMTLRLNNMMMPKTLTSLKLVLNKAEVHLSPAKDTVDHWETLNLASPVSVDIATLSKDGPATLGTTKLAAGRYTELRFYIKSATATLINGRTVNLSLLGKDNIIRILQPFTVISEKNSTIYIDIDADRSLIKAGDTYLLRPVVTRMHQQAE
jgi:hypothetical protein